MHKQGTTNFAKLLQSNAGIWVSYFRHSHASNTRGVIVNYSAASPNGTGNNFFEGSDSTTTRFAVYSNGGIANYSANNVNLSDVRTKTDILGSHNDGSIIRARNGVFLAIPLPAAGRNNRGGRWTPGTWQFRNGVRLRFVKTPRGGLLVADDFRLTKGRGIGIRKRGKRRKDGMLTGAASVPIFALVRQVKMPKRLNLYPAAQQIASRVPSAIAAKFQAIK
jgi:hypothetical protein